METNVVIEPLIKLLDIFLAVIRVVGLFLAVKGVVEFVQGITQKDSQGMVHGGMFIAAGIILVFIKQLLGLMGITW